MSDERPDPDKLLARAQAAEARAARGKLKIFFGASAGVGKTYAMLEAAQGLRAQGCDVIAGIVETHGRVETAALLQGIDSLPLKRVSHKGRVLNEFDLDAALARRPAVLLVDELAHSNAAGSRHPRRWQDIDELLAAGIDVLTTVNVQHLESLNDVVGGITGIRVWETVPDHVFDDADEVVLVDLPTDDLLQRLKDGKIYLPEQAERAVQHFFRKGNLMALRELALRRTAERVDDEVRSYRREFVDGGARTVWHTSDALLVCVGPHVGAEKVARAAARRAGRSNAPWHAVYVETPALQRLSGPQRRDILSVLALAETLGASTATLSGEDAVESSIAYAREHNLGTVVIGRSAASKLGRWWPRRHFAQRLAARASDIEIMLVSREDSEPARRAAPAVQASANIPDGTSRGPWPGLAWAVASSALVTLLCTPLLGVLEPANIVMLFLLAVVGVALKFGRGPALLAALLNVLAFDFFFVPPRFSLAVSDVEYLVTFAVMMIVGLVVGQLTASLRYQARVARNREERARGLYEMARELGQALLPEQVAEIGVRFVENAFRARAAVLLANLDDRLDGATVQGDDAPDAGLAQWAYDHAEAAGQGTDTLPASAWLYVPLKAPMRTRGVIAVRAGSTRLLMIPEQRRLLDTCASLIAIAVERVHFVSVAQETTVSMETERLRNSLLAALSHDLRTPLTALVGLSETLSTALAREGSAQHATASEIAVQAQRTAQLVNNLLEMARLQSGAVKLNLDWLSLEELAGSAIRSLGTALSTHAVHVELPHDLPLLYGDAVLLERLLANLLENAAKYSPPGAPITVTARREGAVVAVDVIDAGRGLPPGDTQALFDKFTRGDKESNTPGVGLGLAICRTIVRAHGGSIEARDRPGAERGAWFRWTLPHRDAPVLAELSDGRGDALSDALADLSQRSVATRAAGLD